MIVLASLVLGPELRHDLGPKYATDRGRIGKQGVADQTF